ncbi:polysaccharide export protein [Rhodobacterales bacterium HKCCE2091]|nr:polysaccharide export protein [Rhodobacterales bacterium HKCCE2091]
MKSLILTLVAIFVASAGLAQDGYRVRPGDVLSIEVLEDPSLNRDVLVLPDGSFSFPFAGTISAGGRSVGQIQSSVAQGISGNFTNMPNVFVSVRTLQTATGSTAAVAAPSTIDVFFLGEFATPGQAQLAPGTTFLQALAASGGFTNFAAQQRIQLRRTDPVTGQQSVSTINYRAIQNGARLSHDIVLGDGDVILAPERRLFE